MTNGAEKALQEFDFAEEAQQARDALEARKSFINSVYKLLAIALQENRDQYAAMAAALDNGEDTYLFDHYVLATHSDEKFAEQGKDFQPTVLLRCVDTADTTPLLQTNKTAELLLAIPVKEGSVLADDTLLDDIILKHKSTIFVYWKVGNDDSDCFEVSAEGVRRVTASEEDVREIFDHATMQDFTAFDVAAALVARLRQDLRNLQLVPHFSVIVDSSGGEQFRQT